MAKRRLGHTYCCLTIWPSPGVSSISTKLVTSGEDCHARSGDTLKRNSAARRRARPSSPGPHTRCRPLMIGSPQRMSSPRRTNVCARTLSMARIFDPLLIGASVLYRGDSVGSGGHSRTRHNAAGLTGADRFFCGTLPAGMSSMTSKATGRVVPLLRLRPHGVRHSRPWPNCRRADCPRRANTSWASTRLVASSKENALGGRGTCTWSRDDGAGFFWGKHRVAGAYRVSITPYLCRRQKIQQKRRRYKSLAAARQGQTGNSTSGGSVERDHSTCILFAPVDADFCPCG